VGTGGLDAASRSMAVWQIPQLWPRFGLVAIREPWAARFRWPGAIQAAADDGGRRTARPHELARMARSPGVEQQRRRHRADLAKPTPIAHHAAR
jgi:hypothetical protein